MSISRVNFFSQADLDSHDHQQQIMLKRAHMYLEKNNIIFNKINPAQYVDSIKSKIDKNITLQDCFINSKLEFFNFKSTFNGLIIHVNNNVDEIHIGDIVNVKPLSVVCIGEITRHNITSQELLYPKQLTVYHDNDILSCCEDITIQQPLPLTCPNQITVKYNE